MLRLKLIRNSKEIGLVHPWIVSAIHLQSILLTYVIATFQINEMVSIHDLVN